MSGVASDPYTMEMELCGLDGMVSGEFLERHNSLTKRAPVTEPFGCTGHAHLAGEHIRCTSAAHVNPPANRAHFANPSQDPKGLLVKQGKAILRVAAELREVLKGAEDEFAPTLFEDLATMEEVGRWLVTTRLIDPAVDLSPPKPTPKPVPDGGRIHG